MEKLYSVELVFVDENDADSEQIGPIPTKAFRSTRAAAMALVSDIYSTVDEGRVKIHHEEGAIKVFWDSSVSVYQLKNLTSLDRKPTATEQAEFLAEVSNRLSLTMCAPSRTEKFKLRPVRRMFGQAVAR